MQTIAVVCGLFKNLEHDSGVVDDDMRRAELALTKVTQLMQIGYDFFERFTVIQTSDTRKDDDTPIWFGRQVGNGRMNLADGLAAISIFFPHERHRVPDGP